MRLPALGQFNSPRSSTTFAPRSVRNLRAKWSVLLDDSALDETLEGVARDAEHLGGLGAGDEDLRRCIHVSAYRSCFGYRHG